MQTMHITGFSGTATCVSDCTTRRSVYSMMEALRLDPQNVLFVTRSPVNQVEQSKVGSSAPDKVVDLSPLGVRCLYRFNRFCAAWISLEQAA